MWLGNPWSDLHGGFGLMLKAHWPVVFEELMGGREREGGVRPYVLSHDLAEPAIAAGRSFRVGLTLFGASARLWAAGCDAIARLGNNGVTPQRQHFSVENIAAQCALAEPQLGLMWCDNEWLVEHPPSIALTPRGIDNPTGPGQLQLGFTSPLQIKLDNVLADTRPHLSALVDRALARLSILAHYAGRETPVSREQRSAIVEALQNAQCLRDDTALRRWDRFSRRQGQSIPIPGIVGQQVWQLDADAAKSLLPWLPSIALIHVGSKTSQGFGAVHAHFTPASLDQPVRHNIAEKTV